MLVGDDLEPPRRQRQQLAAFEKVVRVARPAEAFVAHGEGFVEQDAAGRQAIDERREERAEQVVGHDHRVEAAPFQRPLPALLQIRPDDLDPRIARHVGHGGDVDVDHGEAMPARPQMAGVTPGTAGEVEDAALRPDQTREADDPRRRRPRPAVHVAAGGLHVAALAPAGTGDTLRRR